MSKTLKFAKEEVDLLLKNEEDSIIKEFIPEILALTDKFGNSGQSGGSAPIVANYLSDIIHKLCLQKPISDITGVDEEWSRVADFAGSISNDKLENQEMDVLYQNKRCYSLFKLGNYNPYYLDSIVWVVTGDYQYSGEAYDKEGNTILSRQNVKTFPFQPKTFYIDVTENRVIINEDQLQEVFNYYDKFTL